MRLYYEIAMRSFRRAATYRAAYIAGILTNAFFGAVRCFVYLALYQAGEQVAGFSLRDAISYTWLTQALISIGSGWIIMWDITSSIRSGDVVTDLARPWSYYGYWLSRFVGERGFNLLLRGSLTYLLGVLYFGAALPTAGQALAFGLSVCLALLLSFAVNFIVNISAFWLVDNTGLVIMVNVLLSIFSGMLVPLAFFPPALERVARALPFQAITALPVEAFLGQRSGQAIVQALLLQTGWLVLLTLVSLVLLRAAVRKVVIQGG